MHLVSPLGEGPRHKLLLPWPFPESQTRSNEPGECTDEKIDGFPLGDPIDWTMTQRIGSSSSSSSYSFLLSLKEERSKGERQRERQPRPDARRYVEALSPPLPSSRIPGLHPSHCPKPETMKPSACGTHTHRRPADRTQVVHGARPTTTIYILLDCHLSLPGFIIRW